MLAMIIPGGIIMASIIIYFCSDFGFYKDCTETSCNLSTLVNHPISINLGLLFLIASYILGIINNGITDFIFRYFRNNPYDIQNALLKEIKTNGNINLNKYVGNIYTNSKKCIDSPLCIICRNLMLILICPFPSEISNTQNSILKSYYSAYYQLSNNEKLGSIPLVEQQVAFIRNCLLPLFILNLSYFSTNDLKIDFMLLSFTVILLAFIVMIQRQNKIYSMVWESANFNKL